MEQFTEPVEGQYDGQETPAPEALMPADPVPVPVGLT